MNESQGWLEELGVADLRHKLRAALLELAEVEERLAGALGYPRSDGGPDDPNGGGYVTGDHTAVSLAFEAGKQLERAEASRRDWATEAGRLQHAIEMMCEPMYWDVPTSTPQPGPNAPCICPTAEQIDKLSPRFSRPVCAVHPEGGPA